MNAERWIPVTACDNIPPREGRAAIVQGREIAIFNVGDGFLAVDNRCPHQGGPLADGIVSGRTIVCPLHAWKISLRTGSVERPSSVEACVRSYATQVHEGVIVVELPCDVSDEGKAA
jgi:nitrite reductase (NADH) small subunit